MSSVTGSVCISSLQFGLILSSQGQNPFIQLIQKERLEESERKDSEGNKARDRYLELVNSR